jgi:glycerol dehydrogenase-like iron-containing ADH family enzyme
MKSFHLTGNHAEGGGRLLFPAKITRGEGCIKNIQTGPFRAPFLFAGKYALKKYGGALLASNPDLRAIIFAGEVWPGEVYRVRRALTEAGADCLLALGGGKVMDLAKLIKKDMPSIKLINIPTSASTCAAMTPVAVMYTKEGAYADTLDTPVAGEVIIDNEIFYGLPMSFFAAGAMDAAAKFYEASAARPGVKDGNPVIDGAVYSMASACRERIIKTVGSGWAKQDRRLKRELTELNIILAGMISCLGKNTITGLIAHAAAHAMTHINGAKRFLHGEHVSLGLVIQESVLHNKKNLDEIKGLAEIMDTPVSFSGIGVKKSGLKVFFDAYNSIDKREKISVYAPEKLMYNDLDAFL